MNSYRLVYKFSNEPETEIIVSGSNFLDGWAKSGRTPKEWQDLMAKFPSRSSSDHKEEAKVDKSKVTDRYLYIFWIPIMN